MSKHIAEELYLTSLDRKVRIEGDRLYLKFYYLCRNWDILEHQKDYMDGLINLGL